MKLHVKMPTKLEEKQEFISALIADYDNEISGKDYVEQKEIFDNLPKVIRRALINRDSASH